MARKKKETKSNEEIIAQCPFKIDEKVLASPKITGSNEWEEFTIGAMDVTPKSGLVIAAYDSDNRVIMGGVDDYRKIEESSISTSGTASTKDQVSSIEVEKLKYFGGQVEKARRKTRVSVATLAQKANVREDVLNLFLNGENSEMTFIEFLRLLEVLNLKIDIFREI